MLIATVCGGASGSAQRSMNIVSSRSTSRFALRMPRTVASRVANSPCAVTASEMCFEYTWYTLSRS